MMTQLFHPAVANWFSNQFKEPTEPQRQAWPAIKSGRNTLIAAPTGSGKTLAAFLSAIDELVGLGLDGRLDDTTRVVYVSPLKALSNDIQRNLQIPLAGILEELRKTGLPEANIRTLVRTGDTPQSERMAMIRRPPHIIVTTPESLYILLTSESGRRILRTARTLIVDEIHAVVGDKRGSHLALSIARLENLVDRKLVRIGLSATQRPIEEVARFLVGSSNIDAAGAPNCTIIDTGHIGHIGHSRRLDLGIEVPASPLEAVMSGEVWEEIYDRLAQLISLHRTTLVFVNTRRFAERVARHLAERIGEENITAHHGSLARARRLDAEQRLKSGALRALVATASLELGIDIGAVDLVCQLGSTRSIASFLQRVGRSGHTVGGSPKGRIFPLSRNELVECAALLDCVRRGELDCLIMPEKPVDILAQQMVAAAAADEWTEDELFKMVQSAYPYRQLSRENFNAVVRMLAEGFTTRRGRRSLYLHHDGVNHRLRGRRGARLAAITSGGAIPDTADYTVVLEPTNLVVGTVHEDFAIESMAGDIFQLGNTSWRILRVEASRVRVADAHGQPPTIPFWLGEAPARSDELSSSVSRLRNEIAVRIKTGDIEDDQSTIKRFGADGINWLVNDLGIAQVAAEQIVDYLGTVQTALGVMPDDNILVIERFFDESGSQQIVLHSPFGNRLNRAWGLALRKRFCRKFNFELQAAATEDAIVFSLGPMHSFPLEEVFSYLNSKTVRGVLTQAVLDAPMWNIRWRWNATRSLAVLRRRGGQKIPAQLQRMDAEDLLTAVFPDQVACAENLVGEREIPDHPLVTQTLRDCLEEAMDIDGLELLLASIERGERRLVARDTLEPSPLAQEILSARPYAFLDDAPLEERRTRAVYSRRWLDPESASDLGALDLSAIERVRMEAQPRVESPDELHEALVELGFLTAEEGNHESGWKRFLDALGCEHRAAILYQHGGGPTLWVAAERLPQLKAIFADARLEPEIVAPSSTGAISFSREDALAEILRGRLEAAGPTTSAELARSAGIALTDVDGALFRLEAEGFILRGRFTPGVNETEWCARHLLARIHRYTLNRLRQEIEPISTTDFIRFLFSWQKLMPEEQGTGTESLAAVIEQLEGFEAPAAAWEGEILGSRITDYDPAWLDTLCSSGEVVWVRLNPPRPGSEKLKGSGPI